MESEHWHRMVEAMVQSIDESIAQGRSEARTLLALSEALGYSPHHMSRKFHAVAGLPLREYLRGRSLAFALIELRDSERPILDIALDYGFSSHEAFTRSFRRMYGVSPSAYRRNPQPVVLRTRIHVFDCYIVGNGGIIMEKNAERIKIYRASIPAHQFLYIKNYDSNGYWDFWEKQDQIPGQDCDTICGLLDSVRGKLDGEDGVTGKFSGQVMGWIYEADGRRPEAYGVRLPENFAGPAPAPMQLASVPEGEYMVFEHGVFDFASQAGPVAESLAAEMEHFDYAANGVEPDKSAGRVGYYYFDPEKYAKYVVPVRKKM